MSYNFKKKPTIREVAGVTIDLGQRVNSLMGYTGDLEKAFSLYIEMKGDGDEFTKYIQTKMEEQRKLEKEQDDAKRNGDTDGDNIPSNTKNEGSGSERVRKKVK